MATWGSLEEKYRMLCMKLVLARYAYYVLAVPMMTDEMYDRLEDGLKQFEEQMPQLKHPKSPTMIPGSDNPASYPQSIRWYAENFLEGGSHHDRLPCMNRSRSLDVENEDAAVVV